MKRYIVVNVYSARNAGDAEIMLATADLLDRLRPGASITLSSRYHADDAAFYGARGLNIVPEAIPFPVRGGGADVKRAAAFALYAVVALVLALLARRNTALAVRLAGRARMPGLKELLESDVVVAAGGGYLYSSRKRLNLSLLHIVLTMRLANVAGKRLLMMPQSVGPFSFGLDRWLAARALSGVDGVVVREAISARELEGMSLAKPPVITPDVAVCQSGSYRPRGPRSETSAAGGVVIVAMDWTWARGDAGQTSLERYVTELADVATRLTQAGRPVVVTGHSSIPEQNQDDTMVARQVALRAGGTVTARDLGGDIEALVDTFAAADIVIGTRLHSAIASLRAGTPAIALAYQPKAEGTYRLLGLDAWCFDVERFAAGDVARLAAELASGPDGRATTAAAIAAADQALTDAYDAIL